MRNREQIAPASFLLSVVRTHKCWVVRLSRLRWRRLCLWKCAHARAQAPARTPRRFILRRSERGSRKYCTIRRDARGGWLRPPSARWSCCLASCCCCCCGDKSRGAWRHEGATMSPDAERLTGGIAAGGYRNKLAWRCAHNNRVAGRLRLSATKKNTHTHTARDSAQVCVCFDRFFVCVSLFSRVCVHKRALCAAGPLCSDLRSSWLGAHVFMCVWSTHTHTQPHAALSACRRVSVCGCVGVDDDDDDDELRRVNSRCICFICALYYGIGGACTRARSRPGLYCCVMGWHDELRSAFTGPHGSMHGDSDGASVREILPGRRNAMRYRPDRAFVSGHEGGRFGRLAKRTFGAD